MIAGSIIAPMKTVVLALCCVLFATQAFRAASPADAPGEKQSHLDGRRSSRGGIDRNADERFAD